MGLKLITRGPGWLFSEILSRLLVIKLLDFSLRQTESCYTTHVCTGQFAIYATHAHRKPQAKY